MVYIVGARNFSSTGIQKHIHGHVNFFFTLTPGEWAGSLLYTIAR